MGISRFILPKSSDEPKMFLGLLSEDFLHSLPSLGLISDMILPRIDTSESEDDRKKKDQQMGIDEILRDSYTI